MLKNNKMKIVIGSDHAAYELKEAIKEKLIREGHEVIDVGCDSTESVDYPKYGHAVGRAVASGEAERGIAVCGSGIGISIACNKVPGIRAALCSDTYSAKMTRQHNDANLLCMGARVIGSCLALDIVDQFLSNEFEGGRHKVRVDMMMELEK